MVTADNYSPSSCASLSPCRHPSSVRGLLVVEVVLGAPCRDRKGVLEVRDDPVLDPAPDQGDVDGHRTGVGAPNQTRFVESEGVGGHHMGPVSYTHLRAH